ncbi:autotransporter assembly complex family protein [Comamonas sp. NLF-1-9]|uniref:autotransporter assembly complex protein TamA n=1 Tax=Comamonas sp. NLF-1-9 TaxID=2853163 RepID=UPI001C4578A8|nr:BamA/TamA family outer membrane protein [Comamonas sp. NLF-1-9]QXL84722.1 BamA/TamA family outer membrane protein [Comamonas sp. NLF-1-9]
MTLPFSTPARRLQGLLMLALALLLGACSLMPGAAAPQDDEAAAPPPTFTLRVEADDPAAQTLLQKHLELQRYLLLPDLTASELQRLSLTVPDNARELLATLGYFEPEITLNTSDSEPPQITVSVRTGAQTHIRSTKISLSSPDGDEAARARREQRLQNSFALQPGAAFTQHDWSQAKTEGLRSLQQRRYPVARIADSRADIDADAAEAELSVDYASGPAYRFGTLTIEGGERYDSTGTARIARLPTGEIYSESALLDAQQRLASSGYYDSVFLTLETDEAKAEPGDAPGEVSAPVIAHVREAKLQKAVFGVGFSTDSGARLSLDHTHNRLPWLGWRALSKVQLSNKLKSLSSDWMGLPNAEGWRWSGGALLKRETTGSFVTDSTQWRFGRNQSSEHIERSQWLQYDLSRSHGEDAPPMAATFSANWGWTLQHLNRPTAPTRGWAVAAELGAGTTLRSSHDPFVRARLRGLTFIGLGRVQMNEHISRSSRIALRLEGGALLARKQAALPATLLFLTGGDTSVRGYAWQSIGARVQGDQIYGGRYMTVASVEWQRPIALAGNLTDFETAAFVDMGAVGDTPAQMRPRVGVGAGLRWTSPVGPLQADLAWGVQSRKLRLHLRLGFSF